MKKILLLSFALLAIFATSCKPEASIALDPISATIDAEGGSVDLYVTANYAWQAVTSETNPIVVFPTTAAGDAAVSISVPENTSMESLTYTVTFTATGDKSVATETFTITQLGGASDISAEIAEEPKPSAEGYTIKFSVESNDSWIVSSDVATDTFSPASGNAGTTEVTATLGMNKTSDKLTHNITFTTSQGCFEKLAFEQPVFTTISYGDVVYNVKWLKDGRLWMNDNLRYLPSGKTASSDPKEDNGIWYPNARTAAAKTEADSVAKYGYLYTPAAALAVETFTEENYKSFEGAQGICPKGWHIPTNAEIDTLLQKYWDSEVQKGAPIADMEKDGINMNLGGFRMKNTSIAASSYSAAMPGYIISSTGSRYSVNASTGAISCFVKGAMKTITTTFQRITISDCSVYGGATVRCILDK